MTDGPISPVVAAHLAEVRRVFPDATLHLLPDQSGLLRLPSVALPAGWSRPATSVALLVPPLYPVASPDSFWADADLRLAGGGMPQNTNVTPIPHLGEPGLWFSWHVQGWNAVSGSLLTFVRVVEDRFRRGN